MDNNTFRYESDATNVRECQEACVKRGLDICNAIVWYPTGKVCNVMKVKISPIPKPNLKDNGHEESYFIENKL